MFYLIFPMVEVSKHEANEYIIKKEMKKKTSNVRVEKGNRIICNDYEVISLKKNFFFEFPFLLCTSSFASAINRLISLYFGLTT